MVTIETQMPGSNTERAAWLEISEKSLMKAWDNSADDIFNELLKK
jgi:hypothetical protein